MKRMYVFVFEDHMLDWHSCQICYPLELKLLLLIKMEISADCIFTKFWGRARLLLLLFFFFFFFLEEAIYSQLSIAKRKKKKTKNKKKQKKKKR